MEEDAAEEGGEDVEEDVVEDAVEDAAENVVEDAVEGAVEDAVVDAVDVEDVDAVRLCKCSPFKVSYLKQKAFYLHCKDKLLIKLIEVKKSNRHYEL